MDIRVDADLRACALCFYFCEWWGGLKEAIEDIVSHKDSI